MDNKNEILIYEDKDGITKVNVTFTDEDIWLTQSQLADIAKNYLSETELQRLNLLVSIFRFCRITSTRTKNNENERLGRRIR